MQPTRIKVWIGSQEMELFAGGELLRTYMISTAAKGIGFRPGSEKTPVGRFRIAEKIGADAPLGMVFRGRKPTGEIATSEMEGDVISSRILWLEGLGQRNANTKDRYIYIHGTNREDLLGRPASHGCIRLSNAEVIELFELVEPGCEVVISRRAKPR